MANAVLSLDRQGPVSVVTLQRPGILNALNEELLSALITSLGELSNDETVRAIVITGAGRAFMAGADVGLMAEASASRFRSFVSDIQELTRILRRCPVPVIAAVNGTVVGAGLEIACACDMRIASAAASFAFPEARIGLVVTSGASWLLPRLVGRGWARRLVFTGERVDADQALKLGLVDQVVEPAAFLNEAVALGRRVAEAEKGAVALSKRLLEGGDEASLETVLDLEVEAIMSCLTEGQAKEGLTAFLHKREPSYRREAAQ